MLQFARVAVRSVASSHRTVVTPLLNSAISRRNFSAPVENKDQPIDIPNPFEKERRVCILCKHNIVPDYKNVKLLSQFQSPYTGRIYGRHITGLCKQKQEQVEKAIIRAQNCAMMPTYHKEMDFMQDPRLFDPEKPIRPHKY
ncbi:PREDICTED: 28S ribosomal protein S18c, mitochondrial [Bactrocera latifrons]|uniref:28S ribosomal protein S18c, mitochondrial n=1 Tax=Bactrocera latifrons TaxID=174628 RepID=A0A0K8WH80_BACLA|nr:PREDICTED: 28S ribosomal protein S18c, mitochondrial [Bactrocera latifrons]XP_018785605.1 PREDICTED: 28S ribosomal protein S18c, mitochondrial [Bactrocera latifrons]